jgi:hypothetical protein
MTVDTQERNALRRLAARWMAHAADPVMGERRRLWKAVKDLKMERPVILVETCMLPDFVRPEELACRDPYLRNIEKSLFEVVRHADEIGDDVVVDPYFRVPWEITMSNYGAPLVAHHATATDGSNLAYAFEFAVRSAEDVDGLHLRTRCVDRELSHRRHELLMDIFGDILPVRMGGYDWFDPDPGYRPWLGNLYGGLTQDVFKMIGNDRLLYWVYDEPELIRRLMALVRDDRLDHFAFLEREGLLYQNTDAWMPCPGSYGYVSDLPAESVEGADGRSPVSLSDCWVWLEAQECAPMSPKMFGEMFLPYFSDVAQPFGLAYWGCCEAVHDRLPAIEKAVPNLRAVSISGWSDQRRAAELIGKKYVYSRKPTPAYISGAYPQWELVEKDLRDTFTAARDCNLELCFRDIYTLNGDHTRLPRWVAMARGIMDA